MGTGESGYRRFIDGDRDAFEEVIVHGFIKPYKDGYSFVAMRLTLCILHFPFYTL